VSIALAIGYLAKLSLTKQNWETTGSGSTQRTQNRGTIASLITSVILMFGNIILRKGCAQDQNIELLYGSILSPVLGFMMDIGIGTDEGLQYFKNGDFMGGLSNIFRNLTTHNFIRFVVTFLLDLFISRPIASILKGIFLTTYSGVLEPYMSGIIQAIVSIITFQVYTNQTRFQWAYPDPDEKQRLNGFTIMIVTILSSVMYLFMYRNDTENLIQNISLVSLAFALLTYLSMTGNLDAPDPVQTEIEDEIKMTNGELLRKTDEEIANKYVEESVDETIKEDFENKKIAPWIGVGIFGIIFFIGFIYPLLKRGDCNVKGDINKYDNITKEMYRLLSEKLKKL